MARMITLPPPPRENPNLWGREPATPERRCSCGPDNAVAAMEARERAREATRLANSLDGPIKFGTREVNGADGRTIDMNRYAAAAEAHARMHEGQILELTGREWASYMAPSYETMFNFGPQAPVGPTPREIMADIVRRYRTDQEGLSANIVPREIRSAILRRYGDSITATPPLQLQNPALVERQMRELINFPLVVQPTRTIYDPVTGRAIRVPRTPEPVQEAPPETGEEPKGVVNRVLSALGKIFGIGRTEENLKDGE